MATVTTEAVSLAKLCVDYWRLSGVGEASEYVCDSEEVFLQHFGNLIEGPSSQNQPRGMTFLPIRSVIVFLSSSECSLLFRTLL